MRTRHWSWISVQGIGVAACDGVGASGDTSCCPDGNALYAYDIEFTPLGLRDVETAE